MENNNTPNYADELFQQLQTAQRDLSDKQVMLDRVSAIAERNAHKLREALKTARQLISDAQDDNDRFIKHHKDAIQQLVSFGMDDFTKKVNVTASWLVTLEVQATVPLDFDEDDLEIYIEEDFDTLFSGSFFDDDNVDSESCESTVELRSWNVYTEE